MPVTKFPDPRETDTDGIVAVGGDLHVESLLLAYRQGIFPWPDPSFAEVIWACPAQRGILDFTRLHVPRSLKAAQKKTSFRFTIDKAFDVVIALCAGMPRPDQDGTWITRDMLRAYSRFHKQGHAHSVECWDGEELVGGMYGVDIDGAFAGESMFYLKPNASKLALLHLIDHLRSRGLDWMDIQMVTPHLEALGAMAIPRNEFLDRLEKTRARGLNLF
ncbi:MAG: leucyl/phenylalanyl-tRNA--protein transferase [Deltaproteobacteria bacterium]|nr:leucyl/phenylalanyl-tRNA--protein transferase [Deltaproteobacteria bacterium]